jgi:hypothetical protein
MLALNELDETRLTVLYKQRGHFDISLSQLVDINGRKYIGYWERHC